MRSALLVPLVCALLSGPALAGTRTIFFLHHSTGRNLLDDGNVRTLVEQQGLQQGLNLAVWDHDYNELGLRDADADYLGYSYQIPDNNTDPDGLHWLWTTDNAPRDSMLSRYDVVAFKSCYHPACRINDAEELQQYKTWYLDIRSVLDTYPQKTFVIMSPPPLHRLVTNLTEADNARAFATWLGSPEFLAGHPNLFYFNLFDKFAEADDAESETRNMLRWEYERNHTNPDCHPNDLANGIVGPQFAACLVAAAGTATVGVDDVPAGAPLLLNYPNPFNPRTTIAFATTADGPVQVAIFDLGGRLVRTLLDEHRAAGRHDLVWDGTDAVGQAQPSGQYLCRLSSAEGTVAKALTLVR